MIREIIVVEGKDDVSAVKAAVDCDCITTHGLGFGDGLLEQLKEFQEKRGIILLLDPDYAGNKIRQKILRAVPGAKQAFLPREVALRGRDIGVENASPEQIRLAIKRARPLVIDRRTEFDLSDMYRYGLVGKGSKSMRLEVGREFGIGYCNAKQMLDRLNASTVSRQELESFLRRIKR